MNLHGIVAPYIGTVNPLIDVSVQLSVGAVTNTDFTTSPGYSTPGSFTGAISNGVLTVSAVASGVLGAGDTVAGVDVLPDTEIVSQLSGTAGGPGTYRLSRTQPDVVAAEAMTSALIMSAQVQPMTWQDLRQVEGLNLSGTRRKIYLYGSVDSVNRVSRGGGDLITIANGGVDDGVWLVAQVIEQFPDWVSAAMTLQNEG